MSKYTKEKFGLFVLNNRWFYKKKYILYSSIIPDSDKKDIIQHLQILSDDLSIMKNKYRHIIVLMLFISGINILLDILMYNIHNSIVSGMHYYIYNISMPIFVFLFFYMLFIENQYSKKQYIIWNDYILKWNNNHYDINIK